MDQCGFHQLGFYLQVLKRTPDNLDALYVHFFHEKIPSRMLAASTTTETLDRIINQRPGVAEYHRTRAMVYGFREEFQASLKDFKAAIMIAKKRKRFLSGPECERDPHHRHHKHYGNDAGAPKWEDLDECSEAQLYFLRGACYHQYAISILDRAIQAVNCDNAAKTKEAAKGTDLVVGHRPSKSANRGVQAYVSPDVMQAPLEAYKDAIAASSAQIASLVRKSIRDYEKFLDFFPNPTYAEGGPILSSPTRSSNIAGVDLDEAAEEQGELPSPTTSAAEMEEFLKSANLSTLLFGSALKEQANGNVKEPNFTSSSLASFRNALKDSDIQNAAKNLLSLGTYHPLLVEAWYAIGINLMLLNDWSGASAWHARIIKLQDSVDGYPVFLPARSMSQGA